MYGLATHLADRIHLERYQKLTWYNGVPNELKLTNDVKTLEIIHFFLKTRLIIVCIF